MSGNKHPLSGVTEMQNKDGMLSFFTIEKAGAHPWDFYSRGVLPMMAYTGRLHPKGVPFPGFRHIKKVGI